MAVDFYKNFAERYNSFKGEFGDYDPVYVKFFRTLFHNNNVHDVLDCACGTGHDLHMFHTLGCECVGSDVSKSMLVQARKNFKKCGVNLPLYKLDYRLLHKYFKTQFDAVVCLSSSILHMTSKKEVVRAFQSMRKVLRDKGMLVLTQGTTDRQWKNKPRFILAGRQRSDMWLFVIDYKKRGAQYNILNITGGDRAPELKILSVCYSQILLKDDYAELLKMAGFKKVKFFGSYDFEPYNKRTSNRLIITAFR